MSVASEGHSKQFFQWYGTAAHPVMESHFNKEEVRSLFEEDLSAGRTVPLILTSVIMAGVLLAIISVLFV